MADMRSAPVAPTVIASPMKPRFDKRGHFCEWAAMAMRDMHPRVFRKCQHEVTSIIFKYEAESDELLQQEGNNSSSTQQQQQQPTYIMPETHFFQQPMVPVQQP